MQNANPSQNDLIMTVARCLSGQWLIDPVWLYQHANLLARMESGADMSHIWPKLEASYMRPGDGGFYTASNSAGAGKGEAIGVLGLIGPVYKYGYNSSRSLIAYLDQFAADDEVGSVKLVIDSPGGQSAGTRDAFQAIQNFPKPILIEVRGLMASAALYIGAAGDKIVATQPLDMIGSLGTYNTVADWLAYYASIGLPVYETYAEDSTEKNEEYRQLIESKGKNRELLQQQLKVLNDQFIVDVKDGRGDKLNDKVTKGRIYYTPEAIEMGLVDEMISHNDSYEYLADMQRTTKKQTIQMGLREQILQVLGADKGDDSGQTVEQLTTQLNAATSERDAAQAQVTQLTNQVTQLTSERDTLNTNVGTLTTQNEALQAKVDEYGDQPGAMGTRATKKDGDTPPDDEKEQTWEQKVAGLEHNKAADKIFG